VEGPTHRSPGLPSTWEGACVFPPSFPGRECFNCTSPLSFNTKLLCESFVPCIPFPNAPPSYFLLGSLNPDMAVPVPSMLIFRKRPFLRPLGVTRIVRLVERSRRTKRLLCVVTQFGVLSPSDPLIDSSSRRDRFLFLFSIISIPPLLSFCMPR